MKASWRVGAGMWVVVLGAAMTARATEGPATFAELKAAHERASDEIRGRLEAAATNDDRKARQAELWAEIRSAARRAHAWAEAHRGEPEAIDALVWTVHGLANGYYPQIAEETAKTYNLLAERALDSEKVAPVCYYADGIALASPEAKRFLEAASARSESRLVRGAACLGLARDEHVLARLARRLKDPITRGLLVERWSDVPGLIDRLEGIDADAADRRAEALYDRVLAEFGDVKMPRPYNETPFGDLARWEVHAIRHLGAGSPAPEFEGQDVRGGRLRLSDYRGKVVAVVFWATWCGPCMDMVAQEQALVKRMEGRPFVLLGINGDDDREAAAKAAEAHGMTWPSAWNGGKLGALVDAWCVRAWPTIYVLDGQGRIRYDNLRGEALERAIDKLVAEAEDERR